MAESNGPDELLPSSLGPRLRERLFIPELERLLSDPLGYSLKNNFDSCRVRVEEAIDIINRRCGELAAESVQQVKGLRIAIAVSAAVGAGAILVGLSVPAARLAAYLIAAAEVAAVLWCSRRQRRLAAEASELMRLSERYPPQLKACKTEGELRELARRIGEEWKALATAPPQERGG